MKCIRLGILDCDELAPELKPDYDCYGRMFRDLLEPLSTEVQYRRYNVYGGVFPSQLDECDAYLITGSKTGVYDEETWLTPLRHFILSAFADKVKLIGICFGHQLLADTLGGQAEKSSRGWGVGAMESQCLSAQMPDFLVPYHHSIRLLYSHQDQVTRLPQGALRLYGSEFCPHAAYYIPQQVLSFQGHPEFTKAYCARLMTLRQGRYAPGQYDRAMASLEQELDDQQVARWMIRFISEDEQ